MEIETATDVWNAALAEGEVLLNFDSSKAMNAFRQHMYRARSELNEKMKADHAEMVKEGLISMSTIIADGFWDGYMIVNAGPCALRVVSKKVGYGIVSVRVGSITHSKSKKDNNISTAEAIQYDRGIE